MAISESAKRKIREFSAQLAAEEEAAFAGALIDEIEDCACEIGDACMQQFTEALLARQAAPLESAATRPKCPQCGRPGQHTGSEQRELLTRRGLVTFNEPKCHCRKCRRSFFPSVASVGD